MISLLLSIGPIINILSIVIRLYLPYKLVKNVQNICTPTLLITALLFVILLPITSDIAWILSSLERSDVVNVIFIRQLVRLTVPARYFVLNIIGILLTVMLQRKVRVNIIFKALLLANIAMFGYFFYKIIACSGVRMSASWEKSIQNFYRIYSIIFTTGICISSYYTKRAINNIPRIIHWSTNKANSVFWPSARCTYPYIINSHIYGIHLPLCAQHYTT